MKTPPFAVGQRVKYVGSGRVQDQSGNLVAFYGHTGTIQKVVKSRKSADIAVEDGPGGGPRACARFRAD